jgi:general stress protein YciG
MIMSKNSSTTTTATSTETTTTPAPKARRGFAAMSPEKQREIARMGGKAAHAQGVGHQFNSETARTAGRKGGINNAAKRAAEKGQTSTNA